LDKHTVAGKQNDITDLQQ